MEESRRVVGLRMSVVVMLVLVVLMTLQLLAASSRDVDVGRSRLHVGGGGGSCATQLRCCDKLVTLMDDLGDETVLPKVCIDVTESECTEGCVRCECRRRTWEPPYIKIYCRCYDHVEGLGHIRRCTPAEATAPIFDEAMA